MGDRARKEPEIVDSHHIAGILASRICHDLVSPVGAIANGVDLIREVGAGDAREELAMVGESAKRASALLQFFRIAFGAADEGAMLSRAALKAQADALIATSRVVLEWEGIAGPDMSRAEGRLLCQMLLCARALAGMRGHISVGLDGATSLPLRLIVLSQPGAGGFDQDKIRMLEAPPALSDVTPRLVEFALVHGAAAAARLSPARSRPA